LTDNVVLSSVQRVLVLKRTAAFFGERVHDLERSTANHVLQRSADLQGQIPCRCITG
jgi:hypothetical protein